MSGQGSGHTPNLDSICRKSSRWPLQKTLSPPAQGQPAPRGDVNNSGNVHKSKARLCAAAFHTPSGLDGNPRKLTMHQMHNRADEFLLPGPLLAKSRLAQPPLGVNGSGAQLLGSVFSTDSSLASSSNQPQSSLVAPVSQNDGVQTHVNIPTSSGVHRGGGEPLNPHCPLQVAVCQGLSLLPRDYKPHYLQPLS